MDDYSNIPKHFGIEDITNEEVMEKIDMFQTRFRKIDGFGWWDMEIIKTDAGIHFTSKDFQGGLSLCGVNLALAATDH